MALDDRFDTGSFLGDPNDFDDLVENRDEDDPEPDRNFDDEAKEDGDNEASEKKDSADKTAEERKIKRVTRPQPKLNPERLQSARGLIALKKAFADFKFHGKGHEASDLSRLLACLEHWAHRLFPKLQFDDFLEKLEKLGSKKIVQAYVKRLRLGMEDEIVDRVGDSDTEERPDPSNAPPEEPMDEFDRILAEQVSYYQNNSTVTSLPPTPAPMRTPVASSSAASSLTAEQRERIERNRRAAMEKRQKRLAPALTPVTPPPPPISPLPIDANTTESEENSILSNSFSTSIPQKPAQKIQSDVPGGSDFVDSEDEDIPTGPTTSTQQEKKTVKPSTPNEEANISACFDVEDYDEVSKSPLQKSVSKRADQFGDSPQSAKRSKKDLPETELIDLNDDSSEDFGSNFDDNLGKEGAGDLQNDNEGTNSASGNNPEDTDT